MRKLKYTVKPSSTIGWASYAYLDDGGNLTEAVMRDAWQTLNTQINITVGGVTMHASAWEDPEHWSTDWAEKLGVAVEDAVDTVERLLAAAITDD